jgi:acyl-coenzyme A synthetase/AMP-(fatty) acid ligase
MQLDFVSKVGVVSFPDHRKGKVIMAFVVVNDPVGELDLVLAKDKIRHYIKTNLLLHLAPKINQVCPKFAKDSESGTLKQSILCKES